MSQDQPIILDPTKGTVIFSSNAYVSLIEHVLYHISPSSLTPFCVGGILVGEIKEEDVVINQIIPCFHGHQAKMEFVDNYQKAISQGLPRNVKPLGWYSSRLGDNVEFNPNNLQTHNLFQNMENAKSITLIVGMGNNTEKLPITIKAYRSFDLKNKELGSIKSLPVTINPPDSTNVFQNVQKVIENFQSQKSIHIDELLLENSLRTPMKDLASTSQGARLVLDKFRASTATMNELLLANESKVYSVMNSILRNLQEGFVSVLKNMQGTLKEESSMIMESVDKNFEEIQKDGDKVAATFNEMTDKISLDFGNLMKKILEPKLREFKDNLVDIVEESAGIGQKIEMFTDSVKGQQQTLEQFRDSLEKDTSSVAESINTLKKKLDAKNLGTKKTATKSIEKIQQEMKKIEESLQKIEKMMQN